MLETVGMNTIENSKLKREREQIQMKLMQKGTKYDVIIQIS